MRCSSASSVHWSHSCTVSDVIPISRYATVWSVEQMIEAATERLAAGDMPRKAFLVTIDNENPDMFDVGIMNASARCTEVIAALEVVRVMMLQEMNYLPEVD